MRGRQFYSFIEGVYTLCFDLNMESLSYIYDCVHPIGSFPCLLLKSSKIFFSTALAGGKAALPFLPNIL